MDDEKWYETLMRKAVNAEIGVGNFVDDPNSKFNELNGNIAEAVGVSKDNLVYKAVISPIVDGEAKVSAAINVVKAPVELLDFAYEHASTQVKMAGNEIAHCMGMADDGYYQRSMQDLMQKNNAYNKVVLSMPGELIKGVAHDVTNVVGNYDKFYNPFASLEEKTSVYTSGLNLLMIAEGCAEFAGLRVSGGISKATRVSEFDFNNVPHYSSYSFVKTADEMGLDGVTRDMAAHYDGPMPEVNIQEIVDGINSRVGKNKVKLTPAERAAKKGYSGIGTTKNGGPDFTGTDYLYPVEGEQVNIIEIKMTGDRNKDFTQAFNNAKIDKKLRKTIKEDYTWHHVDDFNPETGTCTMQLVLKEAHEATYTHNGSCSQYDKFYGEKIYNK